MTEYKQNVVGNFSKVSFEEYLSRLEELNLADENDEEEVGKIWEQYDKIKLPIRGTSGSAGYDFCIPFNLHIQAGQTVVVPTGIRAAIANGWFLEMVPRSGLGFKYGLRLENTCGIIDSDYFFADNEGHIMLKLTARTSFSLCEGDRFAQGIFLPYGITNDDQPIDATRTGGFGSTGA